MSLAERRRTWDDVCALNDLDVDRGACALVGTRQVAIFRIAPGDALYAVSNYDPFSGAFVLSRGIVGSVGDVTKVTSPVYKQAFALETGQCIDDPSISIATFEVRAIDGRVQIARP